MKWDKGEGAPHPESRQLPVDPVDAPEPIGLWEAGHWKDTVMRWVTDTGAAVRARMPFLQPQVESGPGPGWTILTPRAQCYLASFLVIEVLLLLRLQGIQ